ncbi:MAG TPA: hypothetical protein VMU30_08695 [Bacteroidota bacterium]|nr:hypothetical protein [Bacteroidota bacterium]
MQIKQTSVMYGMVMGILTVGWTMMTMGQDITLQNFNRVSSLKPIAHTEAVPNIAATQRTTVKKSAVHQKPFKVKTIKPTTVNRIPLHSKHSHHAAVASAKKISVPQPSVAQTTVPQNPQPIIPVENAIWAESKEATPVQKTESGFSSTAAHLALAVLVALLSTCGVLGFIFVRSEQKKWKRFDVYNQRYLPMPKKETAVALPKKPIALQEPRRRDLIIAPALELAESDEPTARNDFELSRALQELKSKQRIRNVVTAKKNVKSKKHQIGNAKKIGTGIGEFELAARLSKMQARLAAKVMS